MRHGYFGRKLSRNKNERRRLLVGLSRDLVIRGRIRTTLAKAKAVQPMVEKLVTDAKKGRLAGIEKQLSQKTSVKKLLTDAKEKFLSRTSGFTRIIRMGKRMGDAAEEVILEFVYDEAAKPAKVTKQSKTKK